MTRRAGKTRAPTATSGARTKHDMLVERYVPQERRGHPRHYRGVLQERQAGRCRCRKLDAMQRCRTWQEGRARATGILSPGEPCHRRRCSHALRGQHSVGAPQPKDLGSVATGETRARRQPPADLHRVGPRTELHRPRGSGAGRVLAVAAGLQARATDDGCHGRRLERGAPGHHADGRGCENWCGVGFAGLHTEQERVHGDVAGLLAACR